jgi:hypothetical protein
MKFKEHTKVKDFSLVLGGPIYQLYLRTFLAKPPLNLCKRRVIVITLFAWLPLLLLSLLNNTIADNIKMSFLFDFGTHVRLLLSLGILIAAEVSVHDRIGFVVRQFIERNIISAEQRSRFDNILASAMRLRDSIFIEISIILFVFVVGHWVWKSYDMNISTWHSAQVNGVSVITPAGYWYYFISLPIFQFILLRWYFRLFIWYRFLWQVSRMPLHLNALHPDNAGGLGFLGYSIFALAPLLLAHTILLSGVIFNRSWHTGVSIIDFKLEIVIALIYLVLLVLSPLFFFMPALVAEKRNGLCDYGTVASGYVNHFYQKWIKGESEGSKSILGSADIQSLADLSNSFQVVRAMRALPVSIKSLIKLIVLIALPLVPLIVGVIPLETILTRLIGIIL